MALIYGKSIHWRCLVTSTFQNAIYFSYSTMIQFNLSSITLTRNRHFIVYLLFIYKNECNQVPTKCLIKISSQLGIRCITFVSGFESKTLIDKVLHDKNYWNVLYFLQLKKNEYLILFIWSKFNVNKKFQ